MTALTSQRWQNSVIAKIFLEVDTSRGDELEILRDRHGMAVVRCRASGVPFSMTVNFLLDMGDEIKVRLVELVEKGESRYLNISGDEIASFTREVGDKNHIHHGARPVIPGLLLLEYALESGKVNLEKLKKLQMRFYNPAFAGEIFLFTTANKMYFVQAENLLAEIVWQ